MNDLYIVQIERGKYYILRMMMNGNVIKIE